MPDLSLFSLIEERERKQGVSRAAQVSDAEYEKMSSTQRINYGHQQGPQPKKNWYASQPKIVAHPMTEERWGRMSAGQKRDYSAFVRRGGHPDQWPGGAGMVSSLETASAIAAAGRGT